MSRRLGRVGSDLSRSNHRTATNHGLHRQSTSDINVDSSNTGKAKQKLSLLFSSVASWTRSETHGDTGKPQTNGTGKRRGLDIGQVVRKYVSMVEQLFTSYSGGDRREKERRGLRRGPHSFTSGRGSTSSKRYKGRLSSAPASLRGSPANSGRLSVGESVKVSTLSEVSTMEELQSAIQAAIAHCKNSIAVDKQQGGAGDKQCKC
ncbi:probable BRI1 kinase inhibitor 1 [Phragmites australis]|uniref:probable BRI1 kinase inhibitor 1 n=1 Tax=Phragmites australis TaxID=29695 RepID=UPI002D790563|nr:probable BRI1 kinase inhibitor 1 [Phragmites australis]